MNRWIMILLLTGLVLSGVSVPQKAVEGVTTTVESGAVSQRKKTGIQENVVLVRKRKEMSKRWKRYNAVTFSYEEKTFRLELYTTAEVDDEKNLLLDDRAAFQIRLVTGKKQYIFLKESIQLGVPDADIFTDEKDLLHVVIRDVRTAQYKITDYVYDAQKKQFIGSDIMNHDGINVISGMD